MQAEGKSGQRMLRTAYHVAAAAIFRPRQSWRRGAPERPVSPVVQENPPASPEARLVEARVSAGTSGAYRGPPGEELAAGPFTAEGTESKAVPWVRVRTCHRAPQRSTSLMLNPGASSV